MRISDWSSDVCSSDLLAACDGGGPTTVGNGARESLNAIDINAAATEAQGDIDTYAANSLENQPTPAPLPTPSPAANPPAPGEPGGLPDDRTPVSEAPFTPESAQGAASVVETYYALLEQGEYRKAWQLWSEGGKARSEGRRVGKEGVSTCRTRWSPDH